MLDDLCLKHWITELFDYINQWNNHVDIAPTWAHFGRNGWWFIFPTFFFLKSFAIYAVITIIFQKQENRSSKNAIAEVITTS